MSKFRYCYGLTALMLGCGAAHAQVAAHEQLTPVPSSSLEILSDHVTQRDAAGKVIPEEVLGAQHLMSDGQTLLQAEQAYSRDHKNGSSESFADLVKGRYLSAPLAVDPRVSPYAYRFEPKPLGGWEARLRLGNAKVCEIIADRAAEERKVRSTRLGTTVKRDSSTFDCVTQTGAIYFVVRDRASLPFQGDEDVRSEATAVLNQAQQIVGAAQVWVSLHQQLAPLTIGALTQQGLLPATPQPSIAVSSGTYSLSLSDWREYVVKLPLNNAAVCMNIAAEAARERARAKAAHFAKDSPYDCLSQNGSMTLYMHS